MTPTMDEILIRARLAYMYARATSVRTLVSVLHAQAMLIVLDAHCDRIQS